MKHSAHAMPFPAIQSSLFYSKRDMDSETGNENYDYNKYPSGFELVWVSYLWLSSKDSGFVGLCSIDHKLVHFSIQP